MIKTFASKSKGAGEWLTPAYHQHNPNTASGLDGVVAFFTKVLKVTRTDKCDLDVRYERIPVEPFSAPPGAEAAPKARPRIES